MLYRFSVPAPPLDTFIEDFWFYEGARPAHLKERIVPSGTVELVINLRDNEFRIYDRVRRGACERFSGAIVSGPYERFFVIDTAEDTAVLGVHFKPGGAFPFFDLSVSELVDMHVDLETLWGRSVGELREAVRAAAKPNHKFRILEATLRRRLSCSRVQHSAVRFALDALSRPGPATVRHLADRVGLSQRQFIEVFKFEVGLTPKIFHRIQRFHHSLTLARTAMAPDWSRLALDSGFFDQSHLIHDFRAFSGFSPVEFLRHEQAPARRGAHLKRNHLPLGP